MAKRGGWSRGAFLVLGWSRLPYLTVGGALFQGLGGQLSARHKANGRNNQQQQQNHLPAEATADGRSD